MESSPEGAEVAGFDAPEKSHNQNTQNQFVYFSFVNILTVAPN